MESVALTCRAEVPVHERRADSGVNRRDIRIARRLKQKTRKVYPRFRIAMKHYFGLDNRHPINSNLLDRQIQFSHNARAIYTTVVTTNIL